MAPAPPVCSTATRALNSEHLETGYGLLCVAGTGRRRLRVGSDVLAETRPVPWRNWTPPKRRCRLRDEGVDIEWGDSAVLTDDGGVTGAFCHYRAEDEAAVREHADRAGLPVTSVSRRGAPLAGE